jgi:hypothetical protein
MTGTTFGGHQFKKFSGICLECAPNFDYVSWQYYGTPVKSGECALAEFFYFKEYCFISFFCKISRLARIKTLSVSRL